MFTGDSKTDLAIEKLVERWNRMRFGTGETNEQLGEQAINQYYEMRKRKRPSQIVWCDSPVQMAAIPVFMTNIVQGKNWSRIVQRMNDIKSDSPAWEEQWQREWSTLLGDDIERLKPNVLTRDFYDIEPPVVEAALQSLQKALKEGLRRKCLTASSLQPHPKAKPNPGAPLPAPFDQDTFKYQMCMNARIEAQAGLRATFDPSSFMTFFGGMFDRRWIAQWIPATADFLLVKHPADVSAVIEKIRTRCEEFRNQANDLSMWMLSTPSRIPEPSADVEITGDGSFPQVVFEGIKNAYVEHNRQQHRRKASTYATYIWCLWLPYSAPWLPFALACRIAYPDLFKEMNDEIDCWAFLAHAACGYYFTDNVAFACRKPLVLLMNESRRIHNDKGPSMVWSDRYSVYSWRGIPVERYMIENPGSIKLSRISTEANAELRRTLINIYGEARYLENAGAALIHEDECGQLYQLALKSDEPLCMVKVRNSTPEPDGSFKHYFLRVPPNMSTARQAVAWTFQMDEDEYSPQMQS